MARSEFEPRSSEFKSTIKPKIAVDICFTIVNNNDDVDTSLNMCQAVLVLFKNFHESSHSLTRAGLKDRDAEWDEKGGSPFGA